MPYLGRKQVPLWNPWDWWTLPEAVNYVVKLDGVEAEEAQRQIRFALTDGALPLKWGVFGPPPDLSLPPQEPEMAAPPVGGPMWETAEIDWEAGTVLDNFDPSVTAKRRVLLIYQRKLKYTFDLQERVSKVPPPMRSVGNRAPAIITPEGENAAATISPSGAAPITAAPYRAPSNVRGRKLQRFVDVWVEDVFQAKPGATDNLPGRDELLELARAKVSQHVTDDHAREIRKKYASPGAKKGGARFHEKAGKT